MTRSLLISPPRRPQANREFAERFCERFTSDPGVRKYIFGYNRYTRAVLRHCAVDAVVDDFSHSDTVDGVPVIPSSAIPRESLVLVAAGGKPLSARERLRQLNVTQLDYFQFRLHFDAPLPAIHFNEGFEEDFNEHHQHYQWVYDRFADEESREVFTRLVNFRLQYDLAFLEGFTDREQFQYFEPFMRLQPSAESFADIGAYDGYTSLTFSKHCPDYRSIHAFEPDPDNLKRAEETLRHMPRTHLHQLAISDAQGRLNLSPDGSGSQLCGSGTLAVDSARLDEVTDEPFSLIKMDIEGAEGRAIDGARATIQDHHPRLAIAVYHYTEGAGPFWRIPTQVLDIRDDYDLYIRHYTESIYETVMFFIPKP